jgi:5'-methylthioadenosine phosphorylase
VPYRSNIFALKQLGCTHIIASGAVGSLREEYKPRSLVIPDQIIDRTSSGRTRFTRRRGSRGVSRNRFARSCVRSSSTPQMAQGKRAAGRSRWRLLRCDGRAGVFDPRREPACIALGRDLIGMTAMPEAKLAREAEIPYA